MFGSGAKKNLSAPSFVLSVLQLYGGKSLQFTGRRQAAPIAELGSVPSLHLHAASAGCVNESGCTVCLVKVRSRSSEVLLDCVVPYEVQRN